MILLDAPYCAAMDFPFNEPATGTSTHLHEDKDAAENEGDGLEALLDKDTDANTRYAAKPARGGRHYRLHS
jgi:hypothetical protein